MIDLLGTERLQSEEMHGSSFYPNLAMCKVNILASNDASDDFNYEVPVEGIIEKRTIHIKRHKGNYDSQGVFETNNFFLQD